MAASCEAISLTRASSAVICSASTAALLVQLDVVRQQARPRFAQTLDFRSDRVAPVGGLAELLLQPRHGGALAAMPLLEPGQFGARGRVLLADRGRLAFQLLEFLPLRFERRFALRPQPLFLFHGRAIPLALLGRFLGVAAQALQLQPRHGEPRIGPREILAQLAHVVIERQPVFLAGLLQRRAAAPVPPRAR